MLGLPFRRFVCRPLTQFCTPERARHGKVLILPGIEGRSPLNTNIVLGLHDAGAPFCLQIWDWTSKRWFGVLDHLQNTARHQRQADLIAAEMVDYRRRFPDRPIHLVGHSGGAALAVLVLERLPECCLVETACLLAAALSPGYDLTSALGRVGRIVNFHSPYDLLFCGIGTTVFGSIDRRYGVSAGAAGFQEPAGLTEPGRVLYRQRLEQRIFTWEMASSCWWGGHQGCTHRLFVERYVAPLLLTRAEWPAGPPAEQES